MSADKTIVLITGANRGIGAALASDLLARPNTVVYAGVRDPAKSEASIAELKKKAASGSEVRVVKIDSNVLSDAANAAKEVQKQTDKVDVIIANAGIAHWVNAVDGDIKVLQDLINVNTIAPIALFQAFYPLLKKSGKAKFAVINTGAGSSTLVKLGKIPFPAAFYGASKSAAAFYIAKLSEELKQAGDKILVASVHPGVVSSDMGNEALAAAGVDPATAKNNPEMPTVTTEESAAGVLKVIDNLTEEQAGFLTAYTGDRLPF